MVAKTNLLRVIIHGVVIAAIIAFIACVCAGVSYAAQEPVKYIDENGTVHQVDEYTVLTGKETELGGTKETWYVAKGKLTFEDNLKVKDGGKANLILCDDAKIKCKDNITVNETSEFKVWGQKWDKGQIEVTGGYFSQDAAIGGASGHTNGLIEIHSGYVLCHIDGSAFNFMKKGACIGAGYNADGGKIRIFGGHVIARTEGTGTGIGGGSHGHSGDILITGGRVFANSKFLGAGIGAGDEADNSKGKIEIRGGNIEAYGSSAAGIGGGHKTDGGTITISGGDVFAMGSDAAFYDSGAGIGGGNEGKAGVINIKGGKVNATSGLWGGAAIGCGVDCEGEITGEVYISGGTVEARPGDASESAGIGGSNGSNGCYVKITGGNVTARGRANRISLWNTNGGAGIGGGDNGNGGKTEISGGIVDTRGDGDAAGIGGGDHGNGGTTIITGGQVLARGMVSGAGIGGGETKTGGNVTISGGTVKAIGGSHNSWSAAGIGGGDKASGSAEGETIRITGGDVTARGGNEAAGIGGGDNGGAANVIIDGGEISTVGGKYGAGIGTGQKPYDENKNDASVKINGGNVNTFGGIDAAGIGGGENADGIKTTINGGFVYAKGKSYGAGIGGGENCKGGDVTINDGIVIAIAGEDCKAREDDGGSAIGCGQGIDKPSDMDSDVYGNLTLGESLEMLTGESLGTSVHSRTADRKKDAAWRNYAKIERCTHSDGEVEKDEEGHKVGACPNCGLEQNEKESHRYSSGNCKICGWEQPRDKRVSFASGEHGEGDMNPYMAYSGEKYHLPICRFDPAAGYAFSGWKVGEEEKKPGEQVEINEDTTVTAMWKSTDGDAWIELKNEIERIESGELIDVNNDVKAPIDLSRDTYPLDVYKNTVTLDLNGYTLDRNIKARATRGPVIGASGTGRLTLMNGRFIGANNTGIYVSENGNVTMKDCTVTENNGYAVWVSDSGLLNIAGKIKLGGNVDGGVLLEKGSKINIAGPLSSDSVIPISLKDTGDEKVVPTKEAPVVITSGLKDNGDISCFTSDDDKYGIGVNENGEAVIGIPTKVSFIPGAGTVDDEHSMPDENAVCGATYTLPECGFKVPEGYEFGGWRKEGTLRIMPAGYDVTVSDNMCFEAFYFPITKTEVSLETGEGHEEIATNIAEEFNAGKEGTASTEGSVVKIKISQNMTISEAEDKIRSTMIKAGISYDGEDGKSGNKWTETVGLKPLAEYESFEELEEAEMQDTTGHGGEQIGMNGRTFYVHWSTPVTSLDLSIDEPVCGTQISVSDEGKPDITPTVILTGVEPSAEAVSSEQAMWKVSGGKKSFKGTITGGEEYDASVDISPNFTYYIPDNVAVKVNGKDIAPENISFAGGVMELRADMAAVHAHSESPVPKWTWNGYESATATFTCTEDPTHVIRITDDDIYWEERSKASCSKQGTINYTAAIEYSGAGYTNTITRVIPKTDHQWGDPEYTWFDDNSLVLAKRQCTTDPSHVDTEVAEVSSEVIRDATCTQAGKTKYTASFDNDAFSTQSKEEENIPKLGHQWGEWEEVTPATETQTGVEKRTCQNEGCSETETRDIPMRNHEHGLTHVEAKEPTCTENGNVDHWICDKGENPCGRCYTSQNHEEEVDDPVIPALGHDYQLTWDWSANNSSATLTYVCRNDRQDAGTLDAEVTASTTAATCDKDGKTLYTATVAEGPDGKRCTDVRQVEIPKIGHKFGNCERFDADNHQRVCKNDSSHVEKEAHNWDDGKVTVWPTVLKEGIKTFSCETCGAEKTEAMPKISPETPVPFTDDMVTMDASRFTYNGRTQKPDLKVSYAGETVDPDDYIVTYSDKNSTKVGTYTVTVKMRKDMGFSADQCERTYTITPATLTKDMVQLSANQFTYSGRTQKPKVQVTFAGEMIDPKNYIVTYSDENSVNVGTYTVTVRMKEGMGFTTDECKMTYTITPSLFTNDMITMSANQFTYSGRTQKPTIKVTCAGEIISPEKYIVTYSNKNSVKAGTYTVTVRMREGMGFTIGEYKMTYVIKKAANTLRVKAKRPAVKYKKLKKRSQRLKVSKLLKIKNKGQGVRKYKLISAKKGKKNFKKFFKINAKKGKLTIKKKLKMGKYKLRLSVTAAGNKNYLKKTQKVTVTLRVK